MTSPTLLAFDTATDVCSVALLRAGQVIERAEHVGQRHSERVLPMAQALLAEAGVGLSQLDAVAFGAGPGSFTGLRIACGVAQGLAYGLDRPVLPVVNLAALALDAVERAPAARRVAALIDARMNEIYWAVYESAGGALTEVIGPSLTPAPALPAMLMPSAPDTLAGEALAVFGEALATAPAARRVPQAHASARTIALLAARAHARGETVPPAQAMPVYVRDRVAQTIDERKAAQTAAAA